jgi:hypothetical protein
MPSPAGPLAFALALTVVAAIEPARAQSRNPSAAGALFRAGRESMERGEVAKACAQFEESQRLESAPGTQLNLAACEAKLGHLARALELFRTVRDRLPGEDFRLAFIDEQMATLSKRVAQLTLVLPSDAVGVRVEWDGVQLGAASMGVALPVDPGRHVAVVRAAGREERRFEWDLREGERRVVAVEPGPASSFSERAGPSLSSGSALSERPGPVAATPDEGASRRLWGWVALAGGAAGISVGAVTGAMTIAAANSYRDHCHDGRCDPTGLDAASTGRTVQIVSPVALALGALGLGAGAYLLLASPPSRAARAVLTPLANPACAGLGAVGWF